MSYEFPTTGQEGYGRSNARIIRRAIAGEPLRPGHVAALANMLIGLFGYGLSWPAAHLTVRDTLAHLADCYARGVGCTLDGEYARAVFAEAFERSARGTETSVALALALR